MTGIRTQNVNWLAIILDVVTILDLPCQPDPANYTHNFICLSEIPIRIWELTLSGKQTGHSVVDLKSPDGQSLFVSIDGDVRCGSTKCSKCSQNLFVLKIQSSGEWILQSMFNDMFLESDEHNVFCCNSNFSRGQLWKPRLAIHAHIVLFSIQSECYARADTQMGRVYADLSTPYLEECGFVMRFKSGMYHLETSDHHYVSSMKTLETSPSERTAFIMILKPGGVVSFRNREGSYLYPHGQRKVLGMGKKPINMQEWFFIRRCPTWVSLRARNRQYLSIFCGEQLAARSKTLNTLSIFNYHLNPVSRIGRLSGVQDKYLALRKNQAILVNGFKDEEESAFKIRWQMGKIYLRACNKAYLTVQPIGIVAAQSSIPGENEKFILRLTNRPFLILRGCYGYVGHSGHQDVMQCNRTLPECIELLACKSTTYHLKALGGHFWKLTSNGTFHTRERFPSHFSIDIRGTNILTILAPNRLFLRGDRSGLLVADSSQISQECLWEF